MEYYPFDSRNPLYREKTGALAEGETLRLRLLLHRDARVREVFFKLRRDGSDTVSTARMQPAAWQEDYRFYECEVVLCEGLYWYAFEYESDYGLFQVTKTEGAVGIVSPDGGWWQQTVYCRDFETPDWLDGGIIYQIFPDRFARSGEKKQGVPADRFLCEDWAKQPEYRQPGDKCSLGEDYYQGDLKGIEQKLDYLQTLGVSCLYLNPIFEAHSNHRYNTADYLKIDPLLGTEDDLVSLIRAAERHGIAIILDGVFSHTGDDSRYFNRAGRYDTVGAWQSAQSPYASWYQFDRYPDRYSSWWGISTLPETRETDLSFSRFIAGENGVIRYWLKKGIRGWRLDVADELPDEFLDQLRLAVKAEGKDKFLLGEVWEDASHKISYGVRRRFLRGKQLDSVMNYPLAEAIIHFVRGGNAEELAETVQTILENYPPQAVKLLMNHIGTHDTARILTRLGSEAVPANRDQQAKHTLSGTEYAHAVRRLKLAAVLQYTMPGVPSLFYGDEAGLTGWGDPFCRAGYPWGRENRELVAFYQKLGQFRRSQPVFVSGEWVLLRAELGCIVYLRKKGRHAVLVAVNRWHEPCTVAVPAAFRRAESIFGSLPKNGSLSLSGEDFAVLSV